MQLPVLSSGDAAPPVNIAAVPDDFRDAAQTARANYSVISLGCPKNLVDTEQMLGRLDDGGYAMVDDLDDAQFVVINTCGFIDSARAESFEAIDEMIARKRAGNLRGVVVTGCLAERNQGELLQSRPDIDALVGVFSRNDIVDVVDGMFAGVGDQQRLFRPAPIRPLSDSKRRSVTPRHFAYLKISEGCDRLCTFCAIPKMRGKHFSKPIDTVVDEAKMLADAGVRELVLVAQDTTYYGIDTDGRPRLADLLERLDAIESLDWIRLMYFYPMHIDERLIQTIANASRVIPYIDMPLQHASDRMLKRMSRKTTRRSQTEILRQLRSGIPNLAMRTTMITGFPGETDRDFDELVEFVSEQRFENLGVFTYSVEPDTPAARLPHRVDGDVATDRMETLMAIQQSIAFEHAESQIGRTLPVILDAALPDTPGVFIGRTVHQAPEIDGVTYVTQTAATLNPGDLIDCQIVANQGYDLAGAAV